jgi:hypothetical protein
MSSGKRIIPGGSGVTDYRHAGGSSLEVWYIANNSSQFAGTTGAPTVNVLRALPFIAPSRGGVLDRIGFNVTTVAVGSAARIGLYQSLDDANLYPGTLLFDSGSIATDAGTTKTATLTAAQGTLYPGRLYWLAIVTGTLAPTLRCLSMAQITPILGADNTFGTAFNVGISVAHAFAALPATFTAGGAMMQAVPIPALFYRFSA